MKTRLPGPLGPRFAAEPRGDAAESWWNALEEDMLECLEHHGSLSTTEIGRLLGLSEETATSVASMLATDGKVSIGCGKMSIDPGLVQMAYCGRSSSVLN